MIQTTETKINERESAIDGEIAETYTAWMVARAEAQRTLESLMCRADWHNENVRRSNVRSDYKTHLYVDGLRVRATFDVLAPFVGDEDNAKAAAAQRAVDAAEAAYDAAEAQYEGWSRFFLVPAGHIHRSMSCSTCNNGRNATTFSWLTDLSGLVEADAVAAHGAWLCTTCFPTAPVEYTNADELAKAAKKAARCPGSGEAPTEYNRHYDGKCPGCGKWQVVNLGSGRIRAHKAKEAK